MEASFYLVRPLNQDQLSAVLERTIRTESAQVQTRSSNTRLRSDGVRPSIIGDSQKVRQMLMQALKASRCEANVL